MKTQELGEALFEYLMIIIDDYKSSGVKIRRLIDELEGDASEIMDQFLAWHGSQLRLRKGIGTRAISDVLDMQRKVLQRMREELYKQKSESVPVPVVLETDEIKILSDLIRATICDLGSSNYTEEKEAQIKRLQVITKKLNASVEASLKAERELVGATT